MIDEITKNVNTTLNIFANIGFLFLIILTAHFIGPYAYFTPRFIQDVPFWLLGGGLGYCGYKLYEYYKNNS
jgi:hypothetical protein